MMSTRNVILIVALLFAVSCVGCSDDDCPTCPDPGDTDPLAAWAGDYNTDTKFGGVSGTWNASSDLTITGNGEIFYGATLILNPVVVGETVSWTVADGNAHNVSITFVTSQTNDYYWADQGGSASGKLFTGSRQSGSDGPLDFRGLNPRLAWVGDYETATKFGGASGTWNASSILRVTESGTFIYGSLLILNPTVDRNAVSWTVTDGNAHNVSITFVTSQTSDYYWADKGGSASGKLFTGSRQSGASGPLDFRGLVALE